MTLGKRFITDGEVELMKDRFEAAKAIEEMQMELAQVQMDRSANIITTELPAHQAKVGPLALEVQRLEKKLQNRIKKCVSLGFKDTKPLEHAARLKFEKSGQPMDADAWRKQRDDEIARVEQAKREAAAAEAEAARKKAFQDELNAIHAKCEADAKASNWPDANPIHCDPNFNFKRS